MNVLFDTNIMIYADDFKEVPVELRELIRLLRKYGHSVFVHPSSLDDIKRDKDLSRRRIMLSKFDSYPKLENPPKPDKKFLLKLKPPKTPNDEVDIEILYAVYKNLVDFLITEDKDIQKKAAQLGLEDRVFSINSALQYFRKLHDRRYPFHPILVHVPTGTLDVNDPFFDSLKEDYPEFTKWFEKISRKGRKCWVYREDGKIQALLIIKEEKEVIPTTPPIPAKNRLKICTLKVQKTGFKMGELLLKIAFQYCVENHLDEIYLTHYRKEDDILVYLIESFGFEMVGTNLRGEEVYLKRLLPPNSTELNLDPVEFARRYYPSFRDSEKIKKFLVPIRPEYHDRLFPDYSHGRQLKITEYTEINVPGNTIKKAYLSHSAIKKIKPGNILLFYRSKDQKCVTSIGIVEKILPQTTNVNEIIRFVGKRTVYSYNEIIEMAKKPVLAVLFRLHFHLKNPVSLKTLKRASILSYAPQTIVEVPHRKYKEIIKLGEIDERFAFD